MHTNNMSLQHANIKRRTPTRRCYKPTLRSPDGSLWGGWPGDNQSCWRMWVGGAPWGHLCSLRLRDGADSTSRWSRADPRPRKLDWRKYETAPRLRSPWSWPVSPDVGRTRLRVGQIRPKLAEVAHKSRKAGQHHTNIGQVRPTLAGPMPELGKGAPNLHESAQELTSIAQIRRVRGLRCRPTRHNRAWSTAPHRGKFGMLVGWSSADCVGKLAGSGRALVDSCANLADIGPTSVDIGPSLVNFGVGPVWAPSRPKLGPQSVMSGLPSLAAGCVRASVPHKCKTQEHQFCSVLLPLAISDGRTREKLNIE